MLKSKVMHLAIPATVVFLLLAACSGPTIDQAEVQEIVVTRNNAALPEGCNPAEVAQLIMSFLDAYNDGNQEKLAELFAFGRESWFSDTIREGENFTAYTEASLLDYLAERQQYNERLQLVVVDIAGPSWHGGADFAFRLRREADDLQPLGRERYVEGGGAIFCQTQQVMVWRMGTVPPDYPESQLAQVCPKPPGNPENVVVACARPVSE